MSISPFHLFAAFAINKPVRSNAIKTVPNAKPAGVPLRASKLLGALAAIVPLFASVALAQMPVVSNTTSTPVPGVGHDYIGDLVETVNPANGSLSLRISPTMPTGRGLTLPFSFAYDTGGINYVNLGTTGEVGGWVLPTSNLVSMGGWSESAPVVNVSDMTWTAVDDDGRNVNCIAYFNYVYQDANGNRHNLNLSSFSGNNPNSACTYDGAAWPHSFSGQYVTQGGEDNYNPVQGAIIASIPSNDIAATLGPVTVSQPDGTTLSFASNEALVLKGELPSSVEDRNGNVVQITPLSGGAYSYTDTLGRTVLQDSGFGNNPEYVTISGYNTYYTLNWTTLSTPSFVAPVTTESGTCNFGGTHESWLNLVSAISSITLPDGKSYSFTYDPTFQLVNKVTYPTGAYVTYTWGFNSQAEDIVSTNINYPCSALYGVPAITDRYVYVGGTNVEHQHFQYSAAWNLTDKYEPHWTTKQTIVTDYDLVRNTPYSYTVYTYSPNGDVQPPNGWSPTNEEPVESSIAYYDTSGTLLKTVYKTWANLRTMTSEETQYPTGQANETTWTYNSREQQTQQNDYDFGASGVGSLLRETVTNYEQFNLPSLVDRPCQVITYGSSGTSGPESAETDYYYDNGAIGTPCSAPGTPSVVSAGGSTLTGHDETNYSATSTTQRGNVTQKTQWLSTGSSPVTTYSYDETGQIVSMTDPCGNPACTDMPSNASHTTNYSYADSFLNTDSSGYITTAGSPPSGMVTNAYLTKITDPLGHTEEFSYGYNDSELTEATDENSQSTKYKYNDTLGRLTETDYPDQGETTLSYNDSTPSVTTTRLITSSLNLSTTSVLDGLGRTIQTQLTTDPQGTTYTATSYDGDGRTYQTYNPTRCSPATTNCGIETTWGVTTYTYDALGRTKTVAEPDGSSTQTSYDQSCTSINATAVGTIVTDEAGNERESCNDGLGRLTGVLEAPNVSGYNYSTTYTYDPLSDLTNVTQNGSNSSNARIRNFGYDSLSRLTSAANPESGTTSYTYDANGNVVTRVAPEPNQTSPTTQTTTTYGYDALNRRLSLTHTNPTGSNADYAYDGTAISGCPGVSVPTITSPTNLIGRRSAMCTQQSASAFSYDPMGRLATEARTNQLSTPITFTTGYQYYLDGSPETITYPSTDILTYVPGGAGRPLGVYDASNTYVSGATYAPHGALGGMANGNTSSFNGIITTDTYNDRLQPILLDAAVPTISVSVSSGTYSSCTTLPCTAVFSVSSSAGITVDDIVTVAGNSNSELNGAFTVTAVASGQVTVNFELSSGGSGSGGTLTDDVSGSVFSLCYDFHLGQAIKSGPCSLSAYSTGNNGNVFQVLNNTDSTRSAVFAYDSLNRITQANTVNTTSANCWGEAYTIDAWGNLTNINPASGMSGSCTYESLSAAPASTSNQLTGYSYDAAGNLLLNSEFFYDQENRLYNPSAPYTYFYDADSARIFKAASSTGTLYWPGSGGEYLTEANRSGTINEEYIYFNGSRIARVDRPSGTVHYYFSDHLGSATAITSASGGSATYYYYYPYGGMKGSSGSDPNHYLFTGKERDSESGLDDFPARYYTSSMGRWMTPDLVGGHLEDPQTLNRYAYVRNNPTSLTDPTGLDFYLNCTQTSDTCQGGHVGTTTTTTDANGNTTSTFNPTVVTSASLQDPNSGNTATVNENGVQITTGGQTYQGTFISNTPAADVQGSGQLQDFSFHINGNCGGSCFTSGEWSYNGTLNQARALLYDRGSFTIPFEDLRAGLGLGAHPGSTQHRFGGADCSFLSCPNSPHLSVAFDPGSNHYVAADDVAAAKLLPKATVPSTGGFHVDAHADWLGHAQDVSNAPPH